MFAPLRLRLMVFDSLRKIYQDLGPTYKNLVAIIDPKSESEAEQEFLHYFKQYVKSLDKPYTSQNMNQQHCVKVSLFELF